jgi:hypothetical protein
MYLKPTTGCQISTLIFEKKIVERGSLLISHEKYIKDVIFSWDIYRDPLHNFVFKYQS